MRSLARHLFIYARKLAIADSEFDPIALAGPLYGLNPTTDPLGVTGTFPLLLLLLLLELVVVRSAGRQRQ